MIAIALLLAVGQVPAPSHQWRLTAENIDNQSLKPQAGNLSGTITGPVTFGKDSPKALVFDGNSKKKHGIVITDNIAAAGLPAKEITVETWVRIDKTMAWGGFVGALQDNGNYERGWIRPGKRRASLLTAPRRTTITSHSFARTASSPSI
jgi:hypothetical protein